LFTTVTNPRGKATQYSFYADNNFRTMTDPTGAITSYSWHTAFLSSVTERPRQQGELRLRDAQ
jgi:YD repeat-containing protein